MLEIVSTNIAVASEYTISAESAWQIVFAKAITAVVTSCILQLRDRKALGDVAWRFTLLALQSS